MSHVVALPSHMMQSFHRGVTMSFSITSSFTLPPQHFIHACTFALYFSVCCIKTQTFFFSNGSL